MEQERREFTEFYGAARDDCLRVVLTVVGDREPAQDLVAEAFTRAWSLADGSGRISRRGGMPGKDPDLGWSWTVIPSKMPRDGQFVISAIPGPVPSGDLQAVWEFAKTSAPIACAKFLKPGQEP
jgi:hypothetical protein